ncbi:nucleotidyltransferase domain-containing protein [uncultured Roseibium sp.]|uniref:nucleotidyltransferase domain-containing protein n=1 Tax=uncultured Roseibium sp. TaxID=1936171 RepID=UPI00261657E3|nr:nucleotidyltransferase domain-containing protein [uncultured Roseibium sp.]
MSILAAALYGSRARGDQNEVSDTDLLLITDDGQIKHKSASNLSLSFYPSSDLKNRAQEGDLFLFHVLSEGETLYDPLSLFVELKSIFQFKSSYNSEVNRANEIAWFIVKCSYELLSTPVLPKRIAWCVRTILISLSANRGCPVFSPVKLDQFHQGYNVLNLIRAKDAKSISQNLIADFEMFLESLDLADPNPLAVHFDDYKQVFDLSENKLGLSLLEHLEDATQWSEYD